MYLFAKFSTLSWRWTWTLKTRLKKKKKKKKKKKVSPGGKPQLEMHISDPLGSDPWGHWSGKGVWECAALKTPFHASPVVRKGPISSEKVSSQDPLLREFGNFSLYSLNFCPNFSSQASKFGKFQFTNHFFQRQVSVRKPHTSEIRAAQPYLKKSSVLSPSGLRSNQIWVTPPPPGLITTKRTTRITLGSVNLY